MNLLFVLHPPAEAEPMEQLGKQTQNLSLGDLFPDACLQSRCEEAIQCLDAQDAYKLGKYFSSPAPSTTGGWIANTWGFLHLSRAASFQRAEVLTIDYLLPAF